MRTSSAVGIVSISAWTRRALVAMASSSSSRPTTAVTASGGQRRRRDLQRDTGSLGGRRVDELIGALGEDQVGEPVAEGGEDGAGPALGDDRVAAREERGVRHEVGDQNVGRLRTEALGVGAWAEGHDHVDWKRAQAGEDGLEDSGQVVEDRAERQVDRALVGEGAKRRLVPRQPFADEHLPGRRSQGDPVAEGGDGVVLQRWRTCVDVRGVEHGGGQFGHVPGSAQLLEPGPEPCPGLRRERTEPVDDVPGAAARGGDGPRQLADRVHDHVGLPVDRSGDQLLGAADAAAPNMPATTVGIRRSGAMALRSPTASAERGLGLGPAGPDLPRRQTTPGRLVAAFRSPTRRRPGGRPARRPSPAGAAAGDDRGPGRREEDAHGSSGPPPAIGVMEIPWAFDGEGIWVGFVPPIGTHPAQMEGWHESRPDGGAAGYPRLRASIQSSSRPIDAGSGAPANDASISAMARSVRPGAWWITTSRPTSASAASVMASSTVAWP